MDFSLTQEQRMLQDSIAKFIQQDYDFQSRKRWVDSEPGYSREHWRLYAELGWLAVPFCEDDGGFGGSAIDLMLMMEALGKGMVVEPILPCVVLSGGLIAAAGSQAQKHNLLGALIDGRLQLAFAFNEPQSRYNLANISTRAELRGGSYVVNGHKSVVLNGGSADSLIVAVRTSGDQLDNSGVSLLLVDANARGVSRHSYTTVDGHRAAEIDFNNVEVPAADLLGEVGLALPIIERAMDRAGLALCAEAVGAMEVAYRKTVEYTKTRKQFGVAIASFQALQHRMADMFIDCEMARSIVIMAALELDANKGAAPKALSAAKSCVGRAARKIGQEAVQLHGGIGVTDELDVGHLFKRLTTVQYLFGSTDYHTQRFASL